MKVVPKNDQIRKVIAHPVAGPFRAEGSADWPDDVYTHRRINDGDVTVEESGGAQAAPAKAKAEAKKE